MAADPQTLAALGALEEAHASLDRAIRLLKAPGATEQDIQQAVTRCSDVVEHATDAKDLLDLRRKPLFFGRN